MRRSVVLGAGVLLFLIMGTVFLGCGGGGAASVVASITLAPANVSLNRGATQQITPQAFDANHNPIGAPTLAYSSDHPERITVSNTGLICAGRWDANFIQCQTSDSANNLLPLGTASITVASTTASNVSFSSSAVVVTVHERIDSVQVLPSSSIPNCAAPPATACVSQSGTAPFTLQAFTNDPAACQRIGFASAPCQVPPDTVGSVNWAMSPAQVATADAFIKATTDPVCMTASVPGQGVVVGSVGPPGSTVSGSATFTTCAVASIHVHQQNTMPTPPDTATSFTAPVGGTVPLVADVFDSNTPPVQLTSTLALTWLSSQPALASVSASTAQGATVQALAPGTASITAACLPPACNVNFVPPQPVYSDNAVTATITGTVDSTVLVTTATAPTCSATTSCSNSNVIVPIDTTTNAAGTPFTLPAGVQVNSMVMTPAGNPAFLGTICANGTTGPSGAACSGLLRFDPTVSTVASPTPTITGTALTTDGNHVVLADPATNQIFIATSVPSIEAIPDISIASIIAAAPAGATESVNTVTITTNRPHGLSSGQSVTVAGVGVAGYNGVYQVTVPAGPSPTTFTYTDPNSGLAPSGGGYVTGGAAAAISPDGSKIYIVTGQGSQQRPGGKLYVYHLGLPLQNQDLSGGGSGSIDPTSTQAVSFFATGAMAYVANSGAHADDVVALTPPACNDAIESTIAVGHSPTHIAAIPNAGLFPFGTLIPAMIDANSPNIDEMDVDASSASVCPLALTNSFTPHGFAGVASFTAKQLIVTPDSQQAIILTSDHGVLAYNLGTKQTSVVPLTGGAQALSGRVTPDSANLYVGASDGKVHRVDLTKTPPTDAQSIAVGLCPSVTGGCNPDFVVVRPVATVATLSSLAVTPTNPTIGVNGTAQNCAAGVGATLGEICFVATGTFSDKTTRVMTNFVTWTSSNTIVAVIGPTTGVNPPNAITTPGLAKALATGTSTITASSAGVSGSTTLTVQ